LPELAVVTIVRGRLDHLARQQAALDSQATEHQRVLVQMGGPSPVGTLAGRKFTLVQLTGDCDPLPLAAARNAGVAASTTKAVLLLDVDCIPSPSLLERCCEALSEVGGVVAGPVGYLPAGATRGNVTTETLARSAVPHPARPVPGPDELLREDRYELLWSLSFAVSRADFDQVGGFCESYRGYGAEDTDFAFMVRRAGLPFHWVGGAWAWHQHHDVSDPPREHLADIVSNALVFRRRWGCWPMTGWLEAFRDAGLLEWRHDAARCTLTATGRAMTAADRGHP
jgi:N-acetylglucosaminyl-diphospho-decaprenol L-rhamnosyltransferase